MSNCIKVEQVLGCWQKADNTNETITIVREYSESSTGYAQLVRTHYISSDGTHITPGVGETVETGACLRCCGSVLVENLLPPGNRIATLTTSEGQPFDLYETITELTPDFTTGTKIGSYTNESGTVVDLYAPDTSATNLISTDANNQIVLGSDGKLYVAQFVETVTTVSNTVTGHKVADYTNEAGTVTAINETVTALGTPTWDSATSTLQIPYTDETGTTTTTSTQVVIPVGDKYLTTSSDCHPIDSSNADLTFNLDPGLSYIPQQDVIIAAAAPATDHMHGHIVSYDKTTGVAVIHIDQHTGTGTTYCSWQINLDAVAVAAETVTTMTSVVAASATRETVGVYTNEAGAAVTITASKPLDALTTAQTTPTATGNTTNLNTIFKDSAGNSWFVDSNGDATQLGSAASSTILWENVTVNPSPTGNTGGPKFTYNTATGDKYFVDSNGVASLIETGNLSGDIVYVDTTDPSTATIFSLDNPPVTNDPALAGVAGNIYIGTDGSIWSYNGTAYVTKTFAFQGASDEFTATAGQTSFTLTGIPKGKVWMFRNGARLPNASFSVVGTMVTYVPANNGSAALGALVAGDIIDIDYVK